MDTAAAIHITHDVSLFVSDELKQIQSRGAGTINLEILLDDKHTNVHLHDVHYCPEVDSNLLSLGVLEEKNCTFGAISWCFVSAR
jgi:hypothetical protein